MRNGRSWALGIVVVAALAASAAADGGETADAWKAARSDAPARLRAVGLWCTEQKLGRERIAAYERLLGLVPDDADARRALRYVKSKDGSWTRLKGDDPGPSPPEAAAEAARRIDEAVDPLRAAAARAWEDSSLPLVRREQAMADRIAVDPDDAMVRAADRQSRDGVRWRLDETLSARGRSRELREVVARVRPEKAKPQTDAASEEESALAGKVAEVYWNEAVRVVGAQGTKEAGESAAAVAVARPLWEYALGVEPPRSGSLRLFLFPNGAAGFAALDRDTTMKPEERAWFRTLSAAWRPSNVDCLIWADDPRNRVEWSLRQAVGYFLVNQAGVTTRNGWAYEGVGHWFSELVLGSHKCTFVRPSEYAQSGGADERASRLEFLRSSHDWMLAGRELAAKPAWPGVRSVLGKDVNGLTPEELLVSYLLARYVIEGRPEQILNVLRDVGKGSPPDTWVESRLDVSVEGLDRRLRRWLAETGEK